MNTKQILYNALQVQLEAKKAECETYDEEIYKPAFQQLGDDVKTWFTSNIQTEFNDFSFNGDNITLDNENERWREISFKMRGWSSENSYVEFDWSSGNVSRKNKLAIQKAKLIGELASKFDMIDDQYRNNWYPAYKELNKNQNDVWETHNALKLALNNLRNEIRIDSVEAMKQIGFEIKSFKPYYSIDWGYANDERVYKIKTDTHKIKIQHGRSQYDTSYVKGFKVLGKKGNKYEVDIYLEGDNRRTYNVLEKKMDDFINNVVEWESTQADSRKKDIEERYNSYTK